MNWTNESVTILGLSKSGMAAATYLARHGAKCFLSETVPASGNNQASRDALSALGVQIEMGGHSAQCYSFSDRVILSPGIPPSSQVIKELAFSGKELISEVELAYRETTTPLIGITGTNGKTTTTTLISTILTQAGLSAPTCGNIGTPIIGLVDTPTDYLVAELSSFQLAFSPTLRCKVALFLNFKPDHLDWHGSVEAYKQAKASLFITPHTPNWAVLNADDPVCRELGESLETPVMWFSRFPERVQSFPNAITLNLNNEIYVTRNGHAELPLFAVTDSPLVGGHNQENILAAVATALLLDIAIDTIHSAVQSFQGVEHRLERVATISGVTYYNDSKATNPDATLSALTAFTPRQVVLIAGGRDKKTDLSEFVAACHRNVYHVVLIGEATERFGNALEHSGYTAVHTAASLEEAVAIAHDLATEETPVLFSPACASFDMFTNYEARGEAFKKVVSGLG